MAEPETLKLDYKEIKAIPVLLMRHRGDYHLIGEKFQALCGWAGGAGLLGPDTLVIVGSYDNPDEVPKAELRSFAAISAPAAETDVPSDAPEAVERDTLADGLYAVALHRGPYMGLHETYKAMYARIAADGRALRDEPCYEIYLNDPSTASPQELLTEIRMPVD